MNEILDLFFNQFAREAATGRVDCGIMQNVLFKTIIKQFNNRVVVTASMD